MTPSVSDSQHIANVEEKTESGLENQTLAEKPKISPSVTVAKGNYFVDDYCKKYCIATTIFDAEPKQMLALNNISSL